MKRPVTTAPFDEVAWTARLGAALEAVAARAQPVYHPWLYPADEGSYHRQAPTSLAAHAKHDAAAARLLKDAHLQLKSEPTEVVALLREHPLLKDVVVGSGNDANFRHVFIRRTGPVSLSSLAAPLAKLSMKEGGKEAAKRMHRYLVDGANHSLPAHEVAAFHGLTTDRRFELGAEAYLAPYAHARERFRFPGMPKWFPTKESSPNSVVLVRPIHWGPCIDTRDDGKSPSDVSYCFPTNFRVDLEGWWKDRDLLAHLLSISAQYPVLSRTRYIILPDWIQELEVTSLFRGVDMDSTAHVPSTWPESRAITQDDVNMFVELCCGLYPPSRHPTTMHLAIRRLSASLTRVGPRPGLEDRLIDVAISLEALYGSGSAKKLAKRAAALLETEIEEQKRIGYRAWQFHLTRSSVLHSENQAPSLETLESEFEFGRDIALRTLRYLLKYECKWKQVMKGNDAVFRYIDELVKPAAPSSDSS